MKIRVPSRAVMFAVAVCHGALSGATWGQEYPTKPIRMIVGFPAGGGTDAIARVIAIKLRERLGQSIVVDNRPTAGGNLATAMLAKSPPDGYSLIMVSGSHTINPSLYKTQQYDPVKDFAPICQLARSQYLLTVLPSLPAGSVKELIALAKAKPGQLNYASASNGTPPHLAMELFKSMTGTDMVHVPFKGTGQLMTAMLGGQVHLTFANMGSALPHIRAGKLKGLAMSGVARSPAAPEFPTVAEAGVPGFEATGWYGVLAPAGTSKKIVNKLYKEITQALEPRDIQDKLAAAGLEVAGTSPEQFEADIKSEVLKWAKVVKFARMRLD